MTSGQLASGPSSLACGQVPAHTVTDGESKVQFGHDCTRGRPTFSSSTFNLSVCTLHSSSRKNVADGPSAWPIQPMSVGKPNQSGTTEIRPENGGRVQGRTGGLRPRAKEGPFAFRSDQTRARFERNCSDPSDGSMDRAEPAECNRWKHRVRPPLRTMNGPRGPTSAGRRSILCWLHPGGQCADRGSLDETHEVVRAVRGEFYVIKSPTSSVRPARRWTHSHSDQQLRSVF